MKAAAREAETQAQFRGALPHNAEEKARYEHEREEMLNRLKASEAQATRFEKLPRWVTKLFGT